MFRLRVVRAALLLAAGVVVSGLPSSVPANADWCYNIGVTIRDDVHPSTTVCAPPPAGIHVDRPPLT